MSDAHFRHLRPVLVLTLLSFILCGFAYPAFVAGAGEALGLGWQENGSLISVNGTVVGSELIGQNFSSPMYFWPRVSSVNYNSLNGSGGQAIGIATLEFYNQTLNYTTYLIQTGHLKPGQKVPANGVEPSASGFDPDITVSFALFQIPRVHFNTNLSISLLDSLVTRYTVHPFLGFIGSTYVNVVLLDLALHSILLKDGLIR
ncbi:MAG: potassium-transporting ATPase subunit C [Thermoplasmata archaeon]|nr:potassium-transporting ATPase subunit C [Candidatus Sysuiplasma jiujiangense]